MAQVTLYNKEGKEKGKETLVDSLFDVPANDALVYEYVVGFLANQRQGTHKSKKRSEVSGGGVKPWRQKGTGRARSGSNTSSIWVRGNKAFGPTPRDYYSTIPVKKKRGAFLCALSMKARDNKIVLIEDMGVTAPKTKEVVGLFKALKVDGGKNLIVVEQFEKNLFLAARNIKNTEIRKVAQLNAYDLLNCETVLMSKKSLEVLQAKYEKVGA